MAAGTWRVIYILACSVCGSWATKTLDRERFGRTSQDSGRRLPVSGGCVHCRRGQKRPHAGGSAQAGRGPMLAPPKYAGLRGAGVRTPGSVATPRIGGGIPFVDKFVLMYWGIVLFVLVFVMGVSHYLFRDVKCRTIMRHRSSSQVPFDDLSHSMWSLNLVAAVEQVKFPGGHCIHPMIVFVATILMGLLQLFALFLIVDSMDPKAVPITTDPATPWKTSAHAWTVNSMKWVMVTFLAFTVVPEAGEAQKAFTNGVMVDERRLRPVIFTNGRWIILLTAVVHYLITLGVVIAGVSVVLSCQDVPSVLYNSLAITFINSFDDITNEFLEKVFGFESDFRIVHEKLDIQDIPVWVKVFERFVVFLPCLWAYFLIGRAWYTNQMPSAILRSVMAAFA